MSTEQEPRAAQRVRLIMGDQLNAGHSWFNNRDPHTLYVMMEVRQETDTVVHHVQKVLGFFGAMRRFAEHVRKSGHRVLYLRLDDERNTQDVTRNLQWVLERTDAGIFGYQRPDEHRLDLQLTAFGKECGRTVELADTEHFLTGREDLQRFFLGRKQYLMEGFYRMMRERTGLLMNGALPVGGQWNFDKENRGRPPRSHIAPPPLLFDHDLREVHRQVEEHGVATMGSVDARHFPWPLDRRESLQLLDHFLEHLLPRFGSYQDAMMPGQWALYHSRLSFALNVKMLSPMEVCRAAEAAWQADPRRITLPQVEGFIRQIIGWREFMRGVYWDRMPDYARSNFFAHERQLPQWYWTGHTRMACLSEAITGSLRHAYAHHIQRLMVTGNFALLAGVHPDEVDRWYLGIYIDALQWVEITNTRGMSQWADGGIIATKPYVSSGAYIDRMGHHCRTCHYDVNERTGTKACPFNALYWHFHARNRDRLGSADARAGTLMRLAMVHRTWDRMPEDVRRSVLKKGDELLSDLDRL